MNDGAHDPCCGGFSTTTFPFPGPDMMGENMGIPVNVVPTLTYFAKELDTHGALDAGLATMELAGIVEIIGGAKRAALELGVAVPRRATSLETVVLGATVCVGPLAKMEMDVPLATADVETNWSLSVEAAVLETLAIEDTLEAGTPT